MKMGREQEKDIRVEILEKYKEFAEYVKNVDVEALREALSRPEIEALEKMLGEMNVNSLPHKLSKLTDEMKQAEYPQLKSVHHFPIIKEMSSLSQMEKEKLDDYLVMLNKGSFIYSVHLDFAPGLKNGRVENELVAKKLAERVYLAKCPYSCNGNVSVLLNAEEKAKFDTDVMKYREFGDRRAGSNAMGRLIIDYCPDCEENLEMDDLPDIQFEENLRFIGERDTSLDNR